MDHRSRLPGTRRHYDDVVLHDRLEAAIADLERSAARFRVRQCAVWGVLGAAASFHVLLLMYLLMG